MRSCRVSPNAPFAFAASFVAHRVHSRNDGVCASRSDGEDQALVEAPRGQAPEGRWHAAPPIPLGGGIGEARRSIPRPLHLRDRTQGKVLGCTCRRHLVCPKSLLRGRLAVLFSEYALRTRCFRRLYADPTCTPSGGEALIYLGLLVSLKCHLSQRVLKYMHT